MSTTPNDRIYLFYKDESLQLSVLACLKMLLDNYKSIKRGKELSKLFFKLKCNGFLDDLEFEDNLNPISSNLNRLLLGFKRNKLIITEPSIEILPEGLKLINTFKKNNPTFECQLDLIGTW